MKYVTKVQPVKLLQITEICDGIFVEKYIKLTGGKCWANVNICNCTIMETFSFFQ